VSERVRRWRSLYSIRHAKVAENAHLTKAARRSVRTRWASVRVWPADDRFPTAWRPRSNLKTSDFCGSKAVPLASPLLARKLLKHSHGIRVIEVASI
jgi:hypothetical protein